MRSSGTQTMKGLVYGSNLFGHYLGGSRELLKSFDEDEMITMVFDKGCSVEDGE